MQSCDVRVCIDKYLHMSQNKLLILQVHVGKKILTKNFVDSIY